ncbi:MAG: hypothetical protein HZA90_05190 [Verrucomicrobia bacterium]|nr:hypothetical protein [Verrucomicrobiota bacterium]
MKLSAILVVSAVVLASLSLSAVEPPPLPLAHSHNDYEHARPLLDALDHGFCSVEADVWLVEGRLLVAHDRWAVKPERTLQSLYLDPLRERIQRHGGAVYRGGPPCLLLIDVKSDAEATYGALREVLLGYTNILTWFTAVSTTTNALTVVLSGNRAVGLLAAETVRYAALDGRLPDLETEVSPHLMPLVSDNWTKVFTWRGQGPFPEAERSKLRAIVRRGHEQGRRLRFWAAPDHPAGWQELRDAGADLLNTDHHAGLREFLLRPPAK